MSRGLRVHRLRVLSGGIALLDIEDFAAAAGEVSVVLGGAGSGKTAFAAALSGSLGASGSVEVDGVRLAGPPSRRRRQGLAASVRDGSRVAGCTVAEALRLAGGAAHPRVTEAFERFPQLAGRRTLDAGSLSGGEQHLLQIAAAWCRRPAALVLDSPTVGLAADAAAAVTRLAQDEAARGAAVLWLEQDLRAAPADPCGELVRGSLRGRAAGSDPASL